MSILDKDYRDAEVRCRTPVDRANLRKKQQELDAMMEAQRQYGQQLRESGPP
jgi:hypothetical protein